MSIGTVSKIKCNSFKKIQQAVAKAIAMGTFSKGSKILTENDGTFKWDDKKFQQIQESGAYGPKMDFSKKKFYGYIRIPGTIKSPPFYLDYGFIYWNQETGSFEVLFDANMGGDQVAEAQKLGDAIAAEINGKIQQAAGAITVDDYIKKYSGKIVSQTIGTGTKEGTEGKTVIKIQMKIPRSIAKTIGIK
jgi:hypothetical protein